MLHLNIVKQTNSSFSFSVSDNVSFSDINVYISEHDAPAEILLDSLNVTTGESEESILIKIDDNAYKLDLEKSIYTELYYKDFIFNFRDHDQDVGSTGPISFSPIVKEFAYGIVNKMRHDFEIETNLSGAVGRIFRSNATSVKCSCWDPNLQASTNSLCPKCGGTGVISGELIPIDFHLKKVKTQRNDTIDDAGIYVAEQSVFLTMDRIDFVLEEVILDRQTSTFYQIKNINVSRIGGLRASTRILALSVPSNDSSVLALPTY